MMKVWNLYFQEWIFSIFSVRIFSRLLVTTASYEFSNLVYAASLENAFVVFKQHQVRVVSWSLFCRWPISPSQRCRGSELITEVFEFLTRNFLTFLSEAIFKKICLMKMKCGGVDRHLNFYFCVFGLGSVLRFEFVSSSYFFIWDAFFISKK